MPSKFESFAQNIVVILSGPPFRHFHNIIFRNEALAKKVFFGLFVFALVIFPTVTAAIKMRPTYDVLFSLWNVFYIPPWMRIIPYLIGTVGGYLNFQLKNQLNLTAVS